MFFSLKATVYFILFKCKMTGLSLIMGSFSLVMTERLNMATIRCMDFNSQRSPVCRCGLLVPEFPSEEVHTFKVAKLRSDNLGLAGTQVT